MGKRLRDAVLVRGRGASATEADVGAGAFLEDGATSCGNGDGVL